MNKKQRDWFENYFKPKYLKKYDKQKTQKGVLKNQIKIGENNYDK